MILKFNARHKKMIFILLFSTVLNGCISTVWVYKDDENEVEGTKYIPGIPFYKKVSIYKQNTQYSVTWISAKISIEAITPPTNISLSDDQKPETRIIHKIVSLSNINSFDKIKENIIENNFFNEINKDKIIEEFYKVEPLKNTLNIPDKMISNSLSVSSEVDNQTTYYLNSASPWFGTSNFSHELSSDGTLTKTDIKQESKLAEAITSFIPLKEFITAKHVTPLEKKIEAEYTTSNIDTGTVDFNLNQNTPAKFLYKITLDLNEVGYLYSFTQTSRKPPTTKIKFDIKNGFYTRTKIPGLKASTETPKEEGKSIGLSGSIKFPKDWSN